MSHDELDAGATNTAQVGERPPDLSNAVRIAIPLGVGLIIGVFASIGIQGDVLQRVIRNTPGSVSTILTVAVFGVCIPALVVAGAKYIPDGVWNHFITKFLVGLLVFGGSVLLIIASINALSLGTAGIAERENPALELNLNGEGQSLTLTVEAVAPTLSSNEKMVLRVAALTGGLNGFETGRTCQETTLSSTNNTIVLAYLESGPEKDGSAVAAVTVNVPTGVDTVCAYAVLFDRDARASEDDRNTWAMVNRWGFPPQTSDEGKTTRADAS